MSWECNNCHLIATGIAFSDAGHFARSHGRCETCRQTAECADCRCDGDWGKAARRRDPIGDEVVTDLRLLREELLSE